MDLDSCFTVLYVRIDEWYKSEMVGQVNKHPSVSEQLSDSEILTVMSAGCGVGWKSMDAAGFGAC